MQIIDNTRGERRNHPPSWKEKLERGNKHTKEKHEEEMKNDRQIPRKNMGEAGRRTKGHLPEIKDKAKRISLVNSQESQDEKRKQRTRRAAQIAMSI